MEPTLLNILMKKNPTKFSGFWYYSAIISRILKSLSVLPTIMARIIWTFPSTFQDFIFQLIQKNSTSKYSPIGLFMQHRPSVSFLKKIGNKSRLWWKKLLLKDHSNIKNQPNDHSWLMKPSSTKQSTAIHYHNIYFQYSI